MYNFVLNMWIMKKFEATNLQNSVAKGYITQGQANAILSPSQITTNQ